MWPDGGKRWPNGAAPLTVVASIALVIVLAVGALWTLTRPAPFAPVPLPQFASAPAPDATPAGDGASARSLLPRCEALLPAADLTAVLGQPLGSITTRTTIGTPSPSVGRLARTTCDFTATTDTERLRRGQSALELTAGAYADPAAARAHWQVNVDAQRPEARRVEEVPMGAAHAVLVERSDQAVLLVVHGRNSLTLVAPPHVAGPRPPRGLLNDLALRALPALSAERGEPVEATPVPVADSDAGAASGRHRPR